MEKKLGEKIRLFVDNIDSHHVTPQLKTSGNIDTFDVTVDDKGSTIKKYTILIIDQKGQS